MAIKLRDNIIEIIKYLPGIIFLLVTGLVSKYIGGLVPYVSYLIIAIAFGIFSSNVLKLPSFVEKGIQETHKLWLNTGIVILGSRILLVDLLKIGPRLLLMVVGFVLFGLICVEFLSSRFKLDPKLGSCLAAGTSVCGVSAVIASGGAVNAKEKYIAYAIATILAFDIITVFSYPAIGQIFAIPDLVYGPWAGISMFSTGTTVAAGFANSDTAGQIATICKMARNVFIGIWALAYSVYYTRKGLSNTLAVSKTKYLWNKFPKYIFGFLILMILTNTGFITDNQLDSLKNAYNWLFMLAFVGLGYSIDLQDIRKIGFKPFLVVLISFLIISFTSLGVSYWLFL